MAFRDVIEITAQGGKGGDGAMSMLRLKYIAKGGPDGGHGGKGGSVWLEAINNVTSLDRLVGKRVFKAKTGMQGEGRNRNGRGGSDLTVQVPVGTTATDLDTGEVLADLIEVGQRAIVAQGGQGGRGNSAFASAQRQMPRFAEKGTPGEKRNIRLELRSIADVGLVGYPNAGKSSLLAALSNAKPEIASYPFTTLSPNLGVIERDIERFTLADIPGIIEDAHKGKGLGFEFLRHISRTRLLAYVLDISEAPEENLEALQSELREYDPILLDLPALVVLNKVDVAEPEEVQEEIDNLSRFGLPVVAISALEARGLAELKDVVFAMLPERRQLKALEKAAVEIKVEPLEIKKIEGGFMVTGAEVERLIARFDTTNTEAVAYLHAHFMGMGVNKFLKRAGAKNGDDVYIGEAVFEYFDEDARKEAPKQASRRKAKDNDASVET